MSNNARMGGSGEDKYLTGLSCGLAVEGLDKRCPALNYENEMDGYESPVSPGDEDEDEDEDEAVGGGGGGGGEGRREMVLASLPECVREGPAIFLARVFVPLTGGYKYLLGYALYSLRGALEMVEEEYDCGWRVEVAAVVEGASEDDLVVLRYKLLQGGARLKGGLYDVGRAVYDAVAGYAGYVNPDYGFADDGEGRRCEMWRGAELKSLGHTRG